MARSGLTSSACRCWPFLGMWLGSIVRQKISPKTFRRCFLLFLITLGLELALRPFS